MVKGNGISYKSFVHTTKGSSHILKGLPNQDSYKKRKEENVYIIALADGHGSSKCPKSHIGSDIAVNVFYDLIIKLLKTDQHSLFNKLCAFRHEELPKNIVRKWREKIIEYHNENEENSEFISKKQVYSENNVFFEQYGTTLLSLVLSNHFFFALQIGDGDLLALNQRGTFEHIIDPIPILGVETHSLSSYDAWKYFRFFQKKPTPPTGMPSMFMLSTDGLANSYINKEAFLQMGNDYLHFFQTEDCQVVNRRIPNILKETSNRGSGDDITLALVVDIYKIKEVCENVEPTTRIK